MQTRIEQPHRSTIGGMDANLVALLCYLAVALLAFIPILTYIVWLSPLVFFFMEKNSGFIKFHAIQAVLLGAFRMIAVVIIEMILNAILLPLVWTGGMLGVGIVSVIVLILGLAFMALEILCMVFAYQYKWFKIPVLGNLSEKLVPALGGFFR